MSVKLKNGDLVITKGHSKQAVEGYLVDMTTLMTEDKCQYFPIGKRGVILDRYFMSKSMIVLIDEKICVIYSKFLEKL